METVTDTSIEGRVARLEELLELVCERLTEISGPTTSRVMGELEALRTGGEELAGIGRDEVAGRLDGTPWYAVCHCNWRVATVTEEEARAQVGLHLRTVHEEFLARHPQCAVPGEPLQAVAS